MKNILLWPLLLLAIALAGCAPAENPPPMVAVKAPPPAAASPVHAASVPPLAVLYLPALVEVQRKSWSAAPMPAFLAGQVEQESCVSLKSPKCWNPKVELKTSREYGFGLGQTTIAYRDDGSVRFNKWAELRARYPSLREWTWENRFDPSFQLMALVEMDKASFKLYADSPSARDQIGFTLAGYNGGDGGNKQDKLLCKNTPGCDQTRWFGNVELHSMKSKVPYKGYSKSPYDINREYPRNVIVVRRPKYEPYFLQ